MKGKVGAWGNGNDLNMREVVNLKEKNLQNKNR